MGNKSAAKKKLSDRKKRRNRQIRCLSIPRKGNRFASTKRDDTPLEKDVVRKLKELSERGENPAETSEAPQQGPEPEPVPEPRFAFRVPSPSELTEGRGKRSCRIQQCAFRSCPTNDSPELRDEITFYRFPKVFHACQKWARTVSRERGEQFAPQFTSVVCALHFRHRDTFIDNEGRAAVLPDARPRAEPYTQEEQEKEEELFVKLQEIAKVNEESEREQQKRPRTSESEDGQAEMVQGNEENERVTKRGRPKKTKNVMRQAEKTLKKLEREKEKTRMREEKKRIRESKKIAKVVLPSFVPKKVEVPNLELNRELNTTVDSFGNALPVERNPLQIEATTELERAVQTIANELKPAENAITLQYLDLYSKSATVHYLSVDTGNIVSVGHTQVNIRTDNIATLNYVDNDNTVKHTLRCVNIEHDPSMSALTENETSANDSVVKIEAPDNDPPDISDSTNLFTDNPSISKCIIKEEPIANDESDPNVTNDESIVKVTEGTIKIENESDGSDNETVVKMEIEEFDGEVFKLY